MLPVKLCGVGSVSCTFLLVISAFLSLALVTGCHRLPARRGTPDSAGLGLAPVVRPDNARDCSVLAGKSQLAEDREGCVKAHTQHFSLAYVEFDDAGEFWSIGNQRADRAQFGKKWPNSQIENAVALVNSERNRALNEGRRLVVLTFVHGWHNNASAYDEIRDQNLNSFKYSLEYLATNVPGEGACSGTTCPVVVGVFLSWRGKLVQNTFLNVFTYANRRNAANRVGGVSMTEAVMLLALATKGSPAPYDEANQCQQPDADVAQSLSPPSTSRQFFLVGHSFGGRALLHGTAQAMLALILTQKAEAETCFDNWNAAHPDRPLKHVLVVAPFDLIAFINPADDAFATKSMIEAFKRNGITADELDHPLMLSIKADGDWATGPIMNLGQALAGNKPNMHPYDRGIAHEGIAVSGDVPPPYPSACEQGQLGLKTQSWYYKHSAGGTYNMASHLIADFGFPSDAVACSSRTPDFAGETFVWAPKTPEPKAAGSCLAIIPVKTILSLDNGVYSPDSKRFTVSPQQFYSCPPSKVDGVGKYVGPWNDTPFFVMHAPKSLIPDHEDIFRLGVFNLLAQLTQSSLPTVLNIRATPKTMPNRVQAPAATPLATAPSPPR